MSCWPTTAFGECSSARVSRVRGTSYFNEYSIHIPWIDKETSILRSTPFVVRLEHVRHLQEPSIPAACLFYRKPRNNRAITSLEIINRNGEDIGEASETTTTDRDLHAKAKQLCHYIGWKTSDLICSGSDLGKLWRETCRAILPDGVVSEEFTPPSRCYSCWKLKRNCAGVPCIRCKRNRHICRELPSLKKRQTLKERSKY